MPLAGCRDLGGGKPISVLCDPVPEFVHLGVRLRTIAAKTEEFHDVSSQLMRVEQWAVALSIAQDKVIVRIASRREVVPR